MAGVQRKCQTNSDAFSYSGCTNSEKTLMVAFVERVTIYVDTLGAIGSS